MELEQARKKMRDFLVCVSLSNLSRGQTAYKTV